MNKLDDAIRQTLSAEDAAILDRVGSQPPLAQWLETYRGPFAALNVLGTVFAFVLMGVFVVCVWGFFEAEEVRDMLLWSTAATFAIVANGFLKLWFWLEIQKNAVIWEIKRLEFQVARLAAGRGGA